MKIILGNPGSGKTKELLALSAEKNVPILCESAARVERLLVKAQGYGYNIPTPVTLDNVGTASEVIVDDIERFFSQALNVKLNALSVNRDKSVDICDLDKK
ncbi:MAG: hypothetical protein II508_00010 [Acholeplasmatales bacterium]|jgi:hypothetical protein|nr:hypothetical protein [Acholeplasmatales bacterium]MBQ4356467.1 hypothetical protein [Acholeplasmatales bacterium]